MATKIRLKRIGRRNRPFYRVVVMDERTRRDGSAIEELGWYNPIDRTDTYKLNEERIFHWLKLGALATDTVHNLFQKAGIAFKWHLMKQGLDEKTMEKELQKWQLKHDDKARKSASKKETPEAPVAEAVTEVVADVPVAEPITAEVTAVDEPAGELVAADEAETAPSAEPVVVASEEPQTAEVETSSEESSAVAEPVAESAEAATEDEQSTGGG
ncbi:MAG: 30S ribosomal protein S16 [Candidatus Neomarinimicrobiota bacterium]